MKISVNAPLEIKGIAFHDFVVGRVAKTLSRFSHRITSVNVTLTDENGPRGGIDKQCRVTVVMPRFGQLTTSAQHVNPWMAVGQAADRARRSLLTKLKRQKALRVRRRKARSATAQSQPDEALMN